MKPANMHPPATAGRELPAIRCLESCPKGLTGKDSLLDSGMAVTDVVKVTSKGQITLPVGIRNAIGITDDSYLLVERVGDYILLKKAELRMREIQKILRNEARRKKITRKGLLRDLKRERRKVWAD
jgi:AbrB family looped-hinge helix DNA binding protein